MKTFTLRAYTKRPSAALSMACSSLRRSIPLCIAGLCPWVPCKWTSRTREISGLEWDFRDSALIRIVYGQKQALILSTCSSKWIWNCYVQVKRFLAITKFRSYDLLFVSCYGMKPIVLLGCLGHMNSLPWLWILCFLWQKIIMIIECEVPKVS